MSATGWGFWRIVMAVVVGLTVLSGLLHAADDFARGEATRPRTFALLIVAASTLYLFSAVWSWQDRQYGHVLVLLLSALFFYGLFLSHALALAGAHPILRIAKTTGAFFAFIALAGGVSNLVTFILSAYALARRRPS